MSGVETVDVYVSELPDVAPPKLFPPERDLEVLSKGDECARRESAFCWKLLCDALGARLGVGAEDIDFEKKNGKWRSDSVEFSLSHAGGALAVALSEYSVGIDIEPIDDRDRDGVARRFFTEGEAGDYYSLRGEEKKEKFFHIWTAKEAIFKASSDEAFLPSSVDSSDKEVYTDTLSLSGRRYALSVYCERAFRVRLHLV